MSKLNKKLIFNKFRVKRLIETTPYCWLYEGINEKQNEPVAMKFEKIKGKCKILESEAFLLYYLKGFGIPRIISYGKTGNFNCLIEELLGLALEKIWYTNKKNKFLLKYVCMIGLQLIDRLEYIHSKNVIHRDIKMSNICIGRKDPENIYLIDFGLSHKYKSSRTGKHIKFNNLQKAFGNLKFLSVNGNNGYEQSRRDDLESLGYLLVFLFKNGLPWVNKETAKIDNKMKRYKEVYKIKKTISAEKLCQGLPDEFAKYIKYCRNLEFEQDPNYDYLRNLLHFTLTKNEFKNDLHFFWITKKKSIIEKDILSSDKRFNLRRKKSSSQKRLYNKIKESLEKAKSQEISNGFNFHTMHLHKNYSPVKSNIIYRKKVLGNNPLASDHKKEKRKQVFNSNNKMRIIKIENKNEGKRNNRINLNQMYTFNNINDKKKNIEIRSFNLNKRKINFLLNSYEKSSNFNNYYHNNNNNSNMKYIKLQFKRNFQNKISSFDKKLYNRNIYRTLEQRQKESNNSINTNFVNLIKNPNKRINSSNYIIMNNSNPNKLHDSQDVFGEKIDPQRFIRKIYEKSIYFNINTNNSIQYNNMPNNFIGLKNRLKDSSLSLNENKNIQIKPKNSNINLSFNSNKNKTIIKKNKSNSNVFGDVRSLNINNNPLNNIKSFNMERFRKNNNKINNLNDLFYV